MLKDIKRGEYVTDVEFRVVFDDGHNNGFAFPSDMYGNILLDENPYALDNYDDCLRHPEKFVRFNEVIKEERTYREPDTGTCCCGNEVVLMNDYMGACQCEKCGRWYNLFGQSLLPPEQWED